jgi:hypothetical protein
MQSNDAAGPPSGRLRARHQTLLYLTSISARAGVIASVGVARCGSSGNSDGVFQVTTSDEPLQRWRADAMPLIESLLATTGTTMNALHTGPDAVSASWDQIREVANQGRQWLKTRPCPDEEIGDRLGNLIERCERLAATVALSVNDPASVNFDDLASKIRELGIGTLEFLGRLDP